MDQLDDVSKEFLRVCQRYGGEARSDLLRRETGMSKGQRDRRFNKLEDAGYILVRSADEPINGGGIPPRIAVLTDKARRAIDDGLLDSENEDTDVEEVMVSVGQIEELQSQIDELEERLNMVAQSEATAPEGNATCAGEMATQEGLKSLRDDVDALEEEVIRFEELEEQMEYVYQWIGRAELYVKASRYLFEQLGFDFDAAIDDVESGNNQVESNK